MNKKQRIDSKLNISKDKSNLLELHVLVANRLSWKPDNWQAWDRGASFSIGFVKADMNTTLFDLRSVLIHQLRPDNLPDQYIYLRHVGRGSTICSSRQERTLMARDFAPPFYPHAELCILSAEDMVFHTRYRSDQQSLLPSIVTSEVNSPTKFNPNQSMNSSLPPVTPANRLTLNNTAPNFASYSIERSKSPSFRSLQSLDGSHFFQNNELMMAEINFLDAKKALADAHAMALRQQMMANNSIVMENGLDSDEGSDEGKLQLEEEEERKREEEERRREEEERERIRSGEEKERQRLLAAEEERLQEEETRRREEEERRRLEDEDRIRLEDEDRKREVEEAAAEEEKRRLDRLENERHIEEEIRAEEEKAISELRRKQEERRKAEQDRLAELEQMLKEEEEEAMRKQEEEEREKREAEERQLEAEEAERRQKLIEEKEMQEFQKYENMVQEETNNSEDEEADRAMKLIDDLTMTPRPWAAVKDPNKKKIVRVPKEYSPEENEEVLYLRAKIMTYRSHRSLMETKHRDLLERLADMEENWDEEDNSQFESKWRPKCKEEEVRTPQLYERNRQLRLELQMLYKQADTIITHAQAKKTMDSRTGMAFPSIKNNLRINLQRVQQEVEGLRKRAATAHIKYEAEKSNREGVEKEVRQLRQDLINSKISVNLAGR